MAINFTAKANILPGLYHIDDFTWTRGTVGGVSYIQSSRREVNFTTMRIEMSTSYYSFDNVFLPQSGSYKSRVSIYESEVSSTPLRSFYFEYESEEATEAMYLVNQNGTYTDIGVQSDFGKYYQITLIMNPSVTSDPHFHPTTGNFQYFLVEYPDLFVFQFWIGYTVNYDATISNLPLTQGSIANPSGQVGQIYGYSYNASNNTFYAQISYGNSYFLSIPNIEFDTGFFSVVESAFYYSYEGQKFIYFTFEDNDPILLNELTIDQIKWNGFAIWNLSTNELITWNKALALTYIDVQSNRDVFAYLYLDKIPIDELVSASGYFDYQYVSDNITTLWRATYSDIHRHLFHLEAGSETFGTVGSNYPQWAEDVMMYSAVAFAAAIPLAASFPPVGLPLLVTSFTAAFLARPVGAAYTFLMGKTDEIQTITPTITLRNKLNEHYSLATNSTYVLPTQAKVHKLFLGNFSQAGTDYVAIDESTFTYTEITWMTNGKIYTVDEKLIDSKTVVDRDYVNKIPAEETNFLDNLWSILSKYGLWTISIGVAILFIFVLPRLVTASGSVLEMIQKPQKLVISIIIIAVLIYILKTINGG
jgi:hypothetical protein